MRTKTIESEPPLARIDFSGENPFGISGIDVRKLEQLALIKGLGINQIHVKIKWESITRGMLEYSWDEINEFLENCIISCIHVFITLSPDSGFFVAQADNKTELSSFNEYCEFVRCFVINANSRVKGYTIGTADLFDNRFEYIKFAQKIANIIKEEKSDACITYEYPSSTEEIWSFKGEQCHSVAVPLVSDLGMIPPFIQHIKNKNIGTPVWSWQIGGPRRGPGERLLDGDNMRQVVYRTVQALAAGVEKAFWVELFDNAENPMGLYTGDGKKMKVSYKGYSTMVQCLWPFNSIEIHREGPDFWIYKFIQPEGRTTTVIWAADPYAHHKCPVKISGSCKVCDITGSLANNPSILTINPEPVYIIENSSTNIRIPAHAGLLAASDRPFTYKHIELSQNSKFVKNLYIEGGWDWSLPAGIKPTEYSGFFNFSDKPSKDIQVVGWHPKWKDWHIGPGKYDFSSLERKLDEARRNGYRIGMRLQSVVENNVPAWLIQKYNPPIAKLQGRFELSIVPPWDENIRREFEEFVSELGSRGYHRDPAFVFSSIHGISESTGEEFSLSLSSIRILEEKAELTVEKLRKWVLGRIGAWVNAFGEYAFKLAWVGGSTLGLKQYDEVAKEAVEFAIANGIGARGGFIEMYNYKWNERFSGQYRSEEGYLMTDEARTKNNCYFADENEEYITVKRWRFGMLEEDEHRWRMSTLRALQMRCNFIATYPMCMDIDRQLTEYARLSFGKNINDTSDAWSYLREAYVKHPDTGESLNLKNMERWLFQRDVTGGITKPANRLERTYVMPTDPDGIHYEYNGRSTDHTSCNDYIYFSLDDRFVRTGPYMIKITYLDNSCANWLVEYSVKEGLIVQTEKVKNTGDGMIKTVTFYIHEACLSKLLPNEQDLRIYNGGDEDVTILFVRVIKV